MKIKILLILGSFLFLFACGHKQKAPFVLNQEEVQTDKLEFVIDSLPSYNDLIAPLNKANIQFNYSLLPKDFILSKCKEQAGMQMGVLVADMCYARYFDNVNLSMQYASELEKRILALDLPQKEIHESVAMMEKNLYEKDTLIIVIGNSYSKLTENLLEAQRPALAVLVSTGLWLESARLMICDTTTDSNIGIKSKVWEEHSKDLQYLLPIIKQLQNSEVQNIYNDLCELSTEVLENKASITSVCNSVILEEWER